MDGMKYKVYIAIDEKNHITRVDGGSNEANVDIDSMIFVDEGEGQKYYLCQGNYLDKPVVNIDGSHNYKYVEDTIVELTPEEVAEDIPEQEASELEELEAQVFYTAAMTDTLLEV